MGLTTLTQKVEVDNVASVQVSDPIMDPDSGKWLRLLQVYDTDPVSDTGARPIIEVLVSGDTKALIGIKTPQLTF